MTRCQVQRSFESHRHTFLSSLIWCKKLKFWPNSCVSVLYLVKSCKRNCILSINPKITLFQQVIYTISALFHGNPYFSDFKMAHFEAYLHAMTVGTSNKCAVHMKIMTRTLRTQVNGKLGKEKVKKVGIFFYKTFFLGNFLYFQAHSVIHCTIIKGRVAGLI